MTEAATETRPTGGRAEPPKTELARALDYVTGLMGAEIDPEELAAAERLLIDSLGCLMGGLADSVPTRVLAALPTFPGGVSNMIDDKRLLPQDALLVHAAAIRCLDFNDIYSRRNNHHPSEFVIPIVMALAEIESWDGPRIVRGTALGYRVFLAMGEMWEGLLGRGWAPASSLGQVTAAALVGLLRGMDAATVRNAMAIAALTAPTLGVVFKGEISSMKSLVNGMAARAGWEAADFAAAGLTGPQDAFEGTAGYDAMVGGAFSLPAATDPVLTAKDVSIKAYPTVFMTHAAIAAAAGLAEGLKKATPRRVRVFAPERVVTMAAAENRWTVTTRDAAQFSLPLAVASALVHGRCGVEDLEPEVLQGPEVQSILAVMEIAVEPGWQGYVGGRVEVETAAGETLVQEILHPPGHPENPITDKGLSEKFASLAAESTSAAAAEQLARQVLDLGQWPGILNLYAAVASARAQKDGTDQ